MVFSMRSEILFYPLWHSPTASDIRGRPEQVCISDGYARYDKGPPPWLALLLYPPYTLVLSIVTFTGPSIRALQPSC